MNRDDYVRQWTGKTGPVAHKHGERIRFSAHDAPIGRGAVTSIGDIRVEVDNTVPEQFYDGWAWPDTDALKTISDGASAYAELPESGTATITTSGSTFVCVLVKENVNATLTIRSEGPDVREVIRLITMPGSQVTIHHEGTVNGYISYREARQQADSHVTWGGSPSAAYTFVEQRTRLAGTRASTQTKHRISAEQDTQHDVLTEVTHDAPATKSEVHAHGVARARSKVILRANVKMAERGAKSQGSQELHILALDDSAEADTIPQLDIRNDEVTCTHKASVRGISPEDLFYLHQRGLDTQTARQMITEGFLDQ